MQTECLGSTIVFCRKKQDLNIPFRFSSHGTAHNSHVPASVKTDRPFAPESLHIWRLLTVDEAVRSMARHGLSSGGVWDAALVRDKAWQGVPVVERAFAGHLLVDGNRDR